MPGAYSFVTGTVKKFYLSASLESILTNIGEAYQTKNNVQHFIDILISRKIIQLL
jgi:hypothetical protein